MSANEARERIKKKHDPTKDVNPNKSDARFVPNTQQQQQPKNSCQRRWELHFDTLPSFISQMQSLSHRFCTVRSPKCEFLHTFTCAYQCFHVVNGFSALGCWCLALQRAFLFAFVFFFRCSLVRALIESFRWLAEVCLYLLFNPVWLRNYALLMNVSCLMVTVTHWNRGYLLR